ncbi:MAG: diacylglycerol kinase family protein [Pseudomonadota bacterium]
MRSPAEGGVETRDRPSRARRRPRRRVFVIANPAAGALTSRRLALMITALEAHGCSVRVHQTNRPGEAEHLVAESDLGNVDAIAAAGGDGTFNEVLNGLPQTAPPLAVIPFGTVNVLAKEIGLKPSIGMIAHTVVFGNSRRISIGEANGRRFALMASVGLDAMAVDNINVALKERLGRLAYVYEALKQLTIGSSTTYQLCIEGRRQEARGVIVANGRRYAGDYITSPHADLEKPLLDVCRLKNTGRSAPALCFLSLLRGQFARRDDISITETSEFEILGPKDAPLQADGDVLCRLPATIRVLPRAVDLIFPVHS